MGFVKVTGVIGGEDGRTLETEFLIDTGSAYSLIPPQVAREVGVRPTARAKVILADSRVVEIGVSAAYLRLLDREGAVLVGIMDVPQPILGVTSLEILGLAVNPVEGTLQPTRPFGPAALQGKGTQA